MTSELLLKMPIKNFGYSRQMAVQHIIKTIEIIQAFPRVPVILENFWAPKFWPTMAAMAEATAITGM